MELAGKSAFRAGRFAIGYWNGREIRLTMAGGGERITDLLPGDRNGLGGVAGKRRELEVQIRPYKVKANARDGGRSTPVSDVDGRALFRQLELAIVGNWNPRQGAVVDVSIVFKLLEVAPWYGRCQATTASKKRCRAGELHCSAPKTRDDGWEMATRDKTRIESVVLGASRSREQPA